MFRMRAKLPASESAPDGAHIEQQDQKSTRDKRPRHPACRSVSDAIEDVTRRAQQSLMFPRNPFAHVFQNAAAAQRGILAERALVLSVVIDNPFAPKRRGRVHVKLHSRPARMAGQIGRWSGIKSSPADAGKINLHPGMSVRGSNHILSGEVVEFAAAETGHNA